MHILLVQNLRAGLDTHREQQLRDDIERAGHKVTSVTSREELTNPECDLIVVAGGDGTVEKVVRGLHDTGIPLVIVPRGTANNIACSLGVDGAPETLDSLWSSLPTFNEKNKTLAIGQVSYPGHEKYFVESVGCGLLTSLIASGKENKSTRQSAFDCAENELRHRVNILLSSLPGFQASHYQLHIDGRDFSDRYLLIEIMNSSRAGPALELAPEADPGDDIVEVVLVRHEEKKLLSHYLAEAAGSRIPESPFRRVAGKLVEIQCRASELHIDDKCLTGNQKELFKISTGVQKLFIVN